MSLQSRIELKFGLIEISTGITARLNYGCSNKIKCNLHPQTSTTSMRYRNNQFYKFITQPLTNKLKSNKF